MADIISSEEDLKKALEAKGKELNAVKAWRYQNQFANGTLVATYLNAPTAQVAGEAMVSGNLGGPFDVWIFV